MLGFNDFMDLLDPIEQHRFHQAFEKNRKRSVEEEKFDMELFPKLKSYLLAAFPWDNTDQGVDYWYAIYKRIEEHTTIKVEINLN